MKFGTVRSAAAPCRGCCAGCSEDPGLIHDRPGDIFDCPTGIQPPVLHTARTWFIDVAVSNLTLLHSALFLAIGNLAVSKKRIAAGCIPIARRIIGAWHYKSPYLGLEDEVIMLYLDRIDEDWVYDF